MIAIIDSGICNLGSVRRALAELGADPRIVDQPESLRQAERMILPGVGGFSEGMAHLRAGRWIEAVREEVLAHNKPLLGICLGMQLLASRGTEGGETPGLDLIPGDVVHLSELGCGARIPHAGWNGIRRTGPADPLLAAIPDGTDFYFVHSYALRPSDSAHEIASVDYGTQFTAAVACGSVWGTQFHPEKSSTAGLRLLRNFLALRPC
jgi:glutamine amidotransferase